MAVFKKKYFNPLYFIIKDIIKIPTIRTVLVYGGKSSAKTASLCQNFAVQAYVHNSNTIAYRKESSIIPTTLKKSFNLAIDSTFLFPAVEKQDRRYLFNTEDNLKAEIVMKGCDDPEKAKGIESYKYVYLDELNHFDQLEFEQFDMSLRGIPGQKIFGSWNPVDENSWVKTELVDKYQWIETDWKLPCENSFVRISSCGSVILIKTTYEDNYWIYGSPDGSYGYRDENLINLYEGMRTKNANSYKVNVLGEWGKTQYGGEFLKGWRTEIHTGEHPYNPKLPVHLIFDENVNPYFPCGIFQFEGKHIWLVHAIAMKNPSNTVKAMGREIAAVLHRWGHKAEDIVFVGGDPTSQKEDVKSEKGHDFFRIIMGEIAEFRPRRATLTGPPSVKASAEFVNAILEHNAQGLTISVDKKSRVAIIDFENTKEDKNGKIDKTTATDPITKVTYQPYGHFVDILRYFVCFTFPHEYILYQKGGVDTKIVTGKHKSKNNY